MEQLILHPSCKPGPMSRISAAIQPTPDGCRARFLMEGDVGRIKMPTHSHSQRQDNLWKTTCFEIFWQPEGGTYYREFNLSPSSMWAAYDFDDFRLNGRDAPVGAIAIACGKHDAKLDLEVSIASELPTPASVALNAVVEDLAGNIQYWALAFPEGQPDFHSKVCRTKKLAGML